MTKKELRMLVEQKVDEAWYNNKDDFFKGVGKATVGGMLGAATLAGGAYALDKGLESQERYEQYIQQQGEKLMYGTEQHYQDWCEKVGLDPNSNRSQEYYEDWLDRTQNDDATDLHETKKQLRQMVERIVRKQLMERTLYTNDIDISDLKVSATDYNDDGYSEWEAQCSNMWYTFRGTFDGSELLLDEIIVGHSGYGRQIHIDSSAMDWFEENLYDIIFDKLEEQLGNNDEYNY